MAWDESAWEGQPHMRGSSRSGSASNPKSVPALGLRSSTQPNRLTQAAKQQETRYHLLILLFCLGILTLSFVLKLKGDVQVVTPTGGWTLPSICAFRNLFGLDCPGCGLTRSFICFAQGDWTASFRFHPLGWMMFLFVVMQIPFRLLQLIRLRLNRSVIYWPGAVWLGWGLMMLLIAQWIIRGIGGKW